MPVQSHFFIATIKGYDAKREVFELASICFAFKWVGGARSFRSAVRGFARTLVFSAGGSLPLTAPDGRFVLRTDFRA
jgi:hypothetical protein